MRHDSGMFGAWRGPSPWIALSAFFGVVSGCGGEVKSTQGEGGSGDGAGGFPDCPAGGCVCPHSECVIGDALPAPCSPCATKVCEMDGFCCGAENGFWDMGCTTHAVNTPECGCQATN